MGEGNGGVGGGGGEELSELYLMLHRLHQNGFCRRGAIGTIPNAPGEEL